MIATDQTVRVFISSTFRDMHAERDHLVTVVFPELRERVEQLGLEFFDVDLRWGVPAKGVDGETANSWEYCRKWIDEVEPFFVCMLGQRYGSVPDAKDFKSDEDKARQALEPRSITDLEVRHAVLNDGRKRRSYFYLRETPVPELPLDATDEQRQIYGEFVGPREQLGRLNALKADILHCGRPVRGYACRWTGEGFTELENFGPLVLEDLWSGVLRDDRYVSKEIWQQALGKDPDTDPLYTDESTPIPRELWEKIAALAKPEPKDPLDADRQQMDAFAAARLRWFHGRADELTKLTDFLDSTDADAPRLAVVAAVPGQGKSALLAKLPTLVAQSSTFLIAHFVGATERSASAYELVKRLPGELDRSDIAWPADQSDEGQEPKLDFNSLCLRLAQRLGDYAGERRIVILLDALNQLSDGNDLQWLPSRLGPSVRVVVSCIEDAAVKKDSPEERVLRGLDSRQPAPLRIPLGPLDEDDVRAIVVAYLVEYCHELDNEHLATLCAMTQARNPLYLLVMLNELRTLGGNDLNRVVPALIASMSQDHPDTVSLFRWVLQRLEVFNKNAPDAVRWWCLYLAHGRVGMSSRELADLLGRKLGANGAATALRIERGLRRYLQRRGPQLDFFHGQLRQAVLDQYGRQVEAAIVHSDIATYFRDLADPEKDQSWKGENPRPFRELTLHLVQARSWTELTTTLEDLFFLESKVVHGLAFDLVKDFADAVQQLPSDHPKHRAIGTIGDALRCDIHFIARHATDYPQGLFQCMWNSCWWYDKPAAAAHYISSADPISFRPWEQRGPKLFELMETWHTRRSLAYPGFRWVCSLRPLPNALGWGLRAVLTGHSDLLGGQIRGLAYSSDGQRIASASSDETARLWDAVTGQGLVVLRGHREEVASVAFSPDNQCVATGSYDHTLRTWDAYTGALVNHFAGHTDRVQSVAYSSDGRHIASGGGHEILKSDSTVRIWDANSGREELCLQGHTNAVFAVAYLPGGASLVSGSADQTVRVWDTTTGQELNCLRGHAGAVRCLAVSPDGQLIVSGSEDHTARIWNIDSGAKLRSLTGHSGGILSIAISRDGRRVVTGSMDTTMRVWDVMTGDCLGVCPEDDVVSSVAFSPDGSEVATGTWHRKIHIWDPQRLGVSPAIREHADWISGIAVAPNDRYFVTGSGDKTVGVWDGQNGVQVRVIGGHEFWVTSVVFSPDCHKIISGTRQGMLKIWNAESGDPVASFDGGIGGIACLSCSPDGRFLGAGSEDCVVGIWDLRSQRLLFRLDGHGNRVFDVQFSPDGKYLVSKSLRNTIVWDVDTGRRAAPGTEAKLLFHEADLIASQSEATGETIIVSTAAGQPVAWFSTAIRHIAAFRSQPKWAGCTTRHLFLIRLEGFVGGR